MKGSFEDDEFGWLEKEVSSVRTQRYFVLTGPTSIDPVVAGKSWYSQLPASYESFVSRFGGAMLYRQHAGYGIGVLASPVESETTNGDRLIRIGHYLDRPAYFRVQDLRNGSECAVYESQAGGLVRASSGFSEWIQSRAKALRSNLGKRMWSKIVSGPAPFSPMEKEIVEGRRHYKWTVLGRDQSGDLAIEVANHSSMNLPFLTLGVRARGGNYVGNIWVRVGDIEPGQVKVVNHECYKRQLTNELFEVFDLGDPLPEEREFFWEFRCRRDASSGD